MAASFSVDSFDASLTAEVKTLLDRVEARLGETTTYDDPFITELAEHLARAGGKRFRPMMCVMAGLLGNPTDAVVEAAVAVELTHLASLYHDDVMDEAPRRRGTESANLRWNNTLAILSGDILFARASSVVSALGPEAVRLQAEAFERLVAGQIHETVGPKSEASAVEHHLAVLADKTGSLIALSARYGGLFGGLPVAALEALTAFGEALGLSFQIADDILDIASEAEQSGKTPGTDLREGIMTLPMLLARAANRPEDAELLGYLGRELPDDVEHARSLELMRANPAMDAAQAEADRFADEAVAQLDVIRSLVIENPDAFASAEKVGNVLAAMEIVCRSTAKRSV